MNFFGQNRLQFLTTFLEIDAFSDDYYRGHSTHLRVIIGLQKFNIILYDNHVIKIYIFFIKKISRNKKIIFNILQYFFDLSCPLLWIYDNKHIIKNHLIKTRA